VEVVNHLLRSRLLRNNGKTANRKNDSQKEEKIISSAASD